MKRYNKLIISIVFSILLIIMFMFMVFAKRWIVALLSLAGFIVSVAVWVMVDEY